MLIARYTIRAFFVSFFRSVNVSVNTLLLSLSFDDKIRVNVVAEGKVK